MGGLGGGGGVSSSSRRQFEAPDSETLERLTERYQQRERGHLGLENGTFIWRPITNSRKRPINVKLFL